MILKPKTPLELKNNLREKPKLYKKFLTKPRNFKNIIIQMLAYTDT